MRREAVPPGQAWLLSRLPVYEDESLVVTRTEIVHWSERARSGRPWVRVRSIVVPDPDMYRIDGIPTCHPETLRRLRRLIAPSPSWTGPAFHQDLYY